MNGALVSCNVNHGGAACSWDINVEWKPAGRARHFDGLRRGLVRRLRIPWVRQTLWERSNPQAGRNAASYGHTWTSTTALANCSFACQCHPNDRYSRKGQRIEDTDD